MICSNSLPTLPHKSNGPRTNCSRLSSRTTDSRLASHHYQARRVSIGFIPERSITNERQQVLSQAQCHDRTIIQSVVCLAFTDRSSHRGNEYYQPSSDHHEVVCLRAADPCERS